MHRRLLAFLSIVIALAAGTTDLNACGDKFLRIGRSPRFKAYAAIHPASILVYVPASATPSTVKDFESALTRAGHRALSVRGMAALSDALGASRYDIIIAILPDAGSLKPVAASAASKPEVLPLVDKPTKSSIVGIEREYGHVLKAGATRYETLAEIDHVMKIRLTGRP